MCLIMNNDNCKREKRKDRQLYSTLHIFFFGLPRHFCLCLTNFLPGFLLLPFDELLPILCPLLEFRDEIFFLFVPVLLPLQKDNFLAH